MTSPVLARDLPDGTRRYAHPVTGEEVFSVTTVLSVIAKPRLAGWAARQAAEYAVTNWRELADLPVSQRVSAIKGAHERMAAKAAATGDAVHELIEAWSCGVAHPDPPREISGFTGQYISFLTDVRPQFLENEATLWSHRHGYAGTCDWIARIGERVILGDTKSGKRVYPEAVLQVTALANADVILHADGTEEPLPPCDELAILHIRPRSWKLVPVKLEDVNMDTFLAALAIRKWQDAVAPRLLEAR